MAGDDMAAELIAKAKRPLEIEPRALRQCSAAVFEMVSPRRRPRTSRRPCRRRSGRRPSRRSKRRDRPSQVVAGLDRQPEVAALLGAAHGADVGDDPGEHRPRLVPGRPLVNFEPVDPEPPLIDQSPAAVRVGDRVEPDIAEARLALADDDRRAVDQDSVDQVFAEKGRRGRRSALDQQVVDVMKPNTSCGFRRISQPSTASPRVSSARRGERSSRPGRRTSSCGWSAR